jgi:hypothetical protein
MARRLGDFTDNVLVLKDTLSNSEIEFKYRLPTTEERVRFSNASIKRENGRVEYHQTKARVDSGMEILTGIREGDFEVPKGNGFVPLSSDPESKYFDKDWKKHVLAYASDLVELLGMRVFETSALVARLDLQGPSQADEGDQQNLGEQ